jgi:hypothetical protein
MAPMNIDHSNEYTWQYIRRLTDDCMVAPLMNVQNSYPAPPHLTLPHTPIFFLLTLNCHRRRPSTTTISPPPPRPHHPSSPVPSVPLPNDGPPCAGVDALPCSTPGRSHLGHASMCRPQPEPVIGVAPCTPALSASLTGLHRPPSPSWR